MADKPAHMSVKQAKVKPAGNYRTSAATVSSRPLNLKTVYMKAPVRTTATQRSKVRKGGRGGGRSDLAHRPRSIT